jgi:ketosteroid isomerase-like protein
MNKPRVFLGSSGSRPNCSRRSVHHVIESDALNHGSMESTDVQVRLHGDTAVVTGITTSTGRFMGQGFTTRERATDVLARLNGRWQCVFSQLTRVAAA